MWSRAKRSSTGPAPRTSRADVAAWRRGYLIRAGFAPDLAAAIAAECAIDLHELVALTERGCPPDLAAQILAPLDHERQPC